MLYVRGNQMVCCGQAHVKVLYINTIKFCHFANEMKNNSEPFHSSHLLFKNRILCYSVYPAQLPNAAAKQRKRLELYLLAGVVVRFGPVSSLSPVHLNVTVPPPFLLPFLSSVCWECWL